MSSTTIADRKYLKNLVAQTITELMDPIESPELFGPQEEIVSAAKVQAVEHKRKYEDQIKNLSPAAKWVLTTNPRITRRDEERPLVFDASGKMEQCFKLLRKTTINANQKQSVKNISDMLAYFIDVVGDDKILRHLGGPGGGKRGSEEYSGAFWSYLYEQKGTSLNTTMDKEIVKLLNFRGAGPEDATFKDFYYASINDVNKSAPKAAMHYIAWKVSGDEDIRGTYSAIFFPISIALGLVTAPLLAKYVTGKFALFVVEMILWEFLIPMFIKGEQQIPLVNMTYNEAIQPFDDLMEEMRKSPDLKVSDAELQKYNDAVDVMDKLMAKYISDWARPTHPEVEADQMKSIRIAAVATRQEADTRDLSSLNRKWMIKAISDKKEVYDQFFKGLDRANPKEIELTWTKAMQVHTQQIGDSLKSVGKKYFDMQRSAGAGILAREGARVDTIAGKAGIDKRIAEIIGIRNPNKVGTHSAQFLRIYSSWASRSLDDNAIQRATRSNVANTWGYVQRQFSDLLPKGTKANPSNKLATLMERGWCVYTRMPLYPLTGKRGLLSLGIMKRGKSGAFFGSFFSGRSSSGIIDGFMKMIKNGTIGITSEGTIVPPEHDSAGISQVSRMCTKKGREMATVAKTVELEFKSGKIEENFYKRRIAFAESYSQFYLEMGILLHRCSSSEELGGYCGGDLPGDIHNGFQAVTAWHNEVSS